MVVALCACHAQTELTHRGMHPVPWAPPEVRWPDKLPPPTVPRERIRELRVAGMKILLEATTLHEVQRRLGGSIGHEGDASEALDWLCVGGGDADGRWILWLTSSEMGGGRYIDGMKWLRVAEGERPDRRCAAVRPGRGVELPIPLNLGMTEDAALNALGRPTFIWKNALFYCHEHHEVIKLQIYTVDSTLRVGISNNGVSEIDVNRTSSD